MALPANKTKIICTIGPASSSTDTIERMIRAGMNVARLNFSHGAFSDHAEIIEKIRKTSARLDHRVAIMADLSGPKIRIGQLATEPLELHPEDAFTLTTALTNFF